MLQPRTGPKGLAGSCNMMHNCKGMRPGFQTRGHVGTESWRRLASWGVPRGATVPAGCQPLLPCLLPGVGTWQQLRTACMHSVTEQCVCRQGDLAQQTHSSLSLDGMKPRRVVCAKPTCEAGTSLRNN